MDDHDVGEDRATDEEDRCKDREHEPVPLFALVQSRCDERPELVEPHRAGEHNAGSRGDFEPEHELLEGAGRQQTALVAGVPELKAGTGRDVAVRAGENAAE